jgi:hypothetical protein
MENIIEPVNKDLIIEELTEDKFLRHTSKGSNQLYIVTHKDSPNTMREIGRLRELAFRTSGGGTGKALDIDNHDTSDIPYKQLISWNPEDQEIASGYRLLKCISAGKDKRGQIATATTHLFTLTDEFNTRYMPYTLELGRSFIQPYYQRMGGRGLFSLDNLWEGLGAFIMLNPDLKYFIGKVTMYPEYNVMARNLLLSFMHYYFPDDIGLAIPMQRLIASDDLKDLNHYWEGKSYEDGHVILNKEVRAKGENIPPLINSYMNLSPTMKTFGTSVNRSFGNVEETGIMVTIGDIYEQRRKRYFDKESFERSKKYIGPLEVFRGE